MTVQKMGTGVGVSQQTSKTVTWTAAANLGANGTATTFFTVAGGAVVIERIAGRAVVNHTVSNVLATLKLGVVGSDALFIALTVANTLLTTAPIWMSTTATAGGLAIPTIAQNTVVTGNVIATVGGTGDVTGGQMEIDVVWRPLTPGATLS
jgi:hypothetical protein